MRHDVSASGHRGRFYAGLFLLTAGTLMLEVIETRLLSVMMWYHLAFFVISASMFGMTAGAVWAYLRRDRHTRETLSYDLGRLTSAFALSTAGSLLVQLTLAPAIVASATLAVVLAELAIAIAVPFFFSGAAVSLALTRSPFPTGRVYAVDLVGAAVGCLGLLAVLQVMDAPSAILLVGAVLAAAALFARSGIGRAPERRPAGPGWLLQPGALALGLAALAGLNAMTRHGLQPILVKDGIERRSGDITFERWNSFSRVIAMPPLTARPRLWGPSRHLPAIAVRQIWLNIDGDAGTVMFGFDGDPESVRFLSYDVTNLVYALRAGTRAAIVGVGGGRDVLSAWAFGSRDVTGVELNPIFVDLLSRPGPFSRFAGLADLPGVRLVNDEARSWFARSTDTFDVVQMSMADTWAATGAGAFTLTENGLYTVEGWRTFLTRLSERGLFSVSRWYQPGDVDETGRMLSLAVATLLDAGVRDPRAHLFVATSAPVATLILSRAPLAAEEIATLRRFCGEFGFEVLASPDAPAASPALAALLAAPDRASLDRLARGGDLDLSAPGDDRPFFFNLLPLDRPHKALRYVGRVGVVGGNLMATLTLAVILLVSLALVAAAIVVPLRGAIREAGRRLVTGGTLYFALLGLGFMLVEMGLLQRLSLFLGHPVHSLSIVLFSLILSAGVGSALSERIRLDSRATFAGWAVALMAYVASLPWWLPGLIAANASAELVVRGGLCLAVIAPAGLLMGFGFPTGIRLAALHDERPTVWFWGINGAAGVLGSVLAIALSIAFGIRATLVLGALCYLALIPAASLIGFASGTARAR
jgi:SAM-dependent methyltransferase